MARSELTPMIYRVQGMITYVRENLSTDEFMLFLDLLVPEPEPEQVKVAKKRKRAKSASKSPRASSIQQAIAGTSTGRGAVVLCDFEVDGKVCHGEPGDGIHDHAMGYSGYHEFQVPLAQEAGAGG